MAGLPWVKVATDFVDHPKAFALAARLADPRAPLHLPAIWGHFARHYAAGSMEDTDFAIRALERSALWTGEPGALVAALLEVGLLVKKGRRIAVHGWEEWQEGHARKLERDRKRLRDKRAKARVDGRATVADASRDGSGEEERERRGEEDHSSLRSERAPSARRPRGGPAPEGFQRVVKHWFDAWERAGRGKHSSLTQAEGAMLKDLVRQLGEDELVGRIDRAFGDPWFLERGDLGLFRKQVQRFAQAGGAGAARQARRLGDLGVEHGGEWWRSLSSPERERFLAERKALDPELDEDAPFPATGVAATRQVEELISRYRGRLEPVRAAAAGGAR